MQDATDNSPVGDHPWINPIGGFGDMLMVSGVLKLVIEEAPWRRFNLVRRTNYLSVFNGHPAVAHVGFPPKAAKIQDVNYWSMEELGPGSQRPFQVLARAFGLKTPVEERLYFPMQGLEDPLLHDMLPWKGNNIVIAPASDSRRKVVAVASWDRLVDCLLADGCNVMQVGRALDPHIRNAYSLLGLTTPAQVIRLIGMVDVVVTSDNFLMHAAHFTGTPAVVVWGPTNHTVYGYPEQLHMQSRKSCGLDAMDDCIGPKRNEGGTLYDTPCPEAERHCMNQHTPEAIYQMVGQALLKAKGKSRSTGGAGVCSAARGQRSDP